MSFTSIAYGGGKSEFVGDGMRLEVNVNKALENYYSQAGHVNAERHGDGVQRATFSFNDWASMHPDVRLVVMKVALRDSGNVIFQTLLPIEYTKAGVIKQERIRFKSEPVLPKARGTLTDVITHTTDSIEGRIVHSALGIMKDLYTEDKAEAIQIYQRNVQRVMVAIWHAVVLDAYNAAMEHVPEYRLPEQNWGGGAVPDTQEKYLDYKSGQYSMMNKCSGAFNKIANFASGTTEQLTGPIGVALMTSRMASFINYRDSATNDPNVAGKKRALAVMNDVTAAANMTPMSASGVEVVTIPRVSNDRLHGDISGDVFSYPSVIGSHWRHIDNYLNVPAKDFKSTHQDVYVPSAETSQWDRYCLGENLHSCTTFVPMDKDVTGMKKRKITQEDEGRVDFGKFDKILEKNKSNTNYEKHYDAVDVGAKKVPDIQKVGGGKLADKDTLNIFGIYVIGQLTESTPEAFLTYIGDVMYARYKAKNEAAAADESAVADRMKLLFPESSKELTEAMNFLDKATGDVHVKALAAAPDKAYAPVPTFKTFKEYILARPRDFIYENSRLNRMLRNAKGTMSMERFMVQFCLYFMSFSLMTFDRFTTLNIPIPIFVAYFRPKEARLQESAVLGVKARWGTTYLDEKTFDKIVCEDSSRKQFEGYRLGHMTMIHNPECLTVQTNLMGGQYIGGCGNEIMHKGMHHYYSGPEWKKMTAKLENPAELKGKCIIAVAISYEEMKNMPRWLDLRGQWHKANFPHISADAPFEYPKKANGPMYGGQLNLITSFDIQTISSPVMWNDRRDARVIMQQQLDNWICGQAGSRHYSHYAEDHIMYRQPHHMMQDRDAGMADVESSNVDARHTFTPGVARNVYINYDTSSSVSRNLIKDTLVRA
jgi:hypothetical protein